MWEFEPGKPVEVDWREIHQSPFDGFIFRPMRFTIVEVIGVINPQSNEPNYIADVTYPDYNKGPGLHWQTSREKIRYDLLNNDVGTFLGMVRSGAEWDADLCSKSKMDT